MVATLILSACLTQTPSLVICGGKVKDYNIYGTFLSEAILKRYEPPRIGILPLASEHPKLDFEFWYRMGVYEITVLSDRVPDGLDAIWIMGGDQELLAEKCIGKKIEKDLLHFYKRGGTIGGTSAGAAIMSRIMIADGNASTLKLSTGFPLLNNIIIDQHFTQRDRLSRLKEAVSRTGLLGIGIDEDTAILVKDGIANVVGRNIVTLVKKTEDKRFKLFELSNGERFYVESPRVSLK